MPIRLLPAATRAELKANARDVTVLWETVASLHDHTTTTENVIDSLCVYLGIRRGTVASCVCVLSVSRHPRIRIDLMSAEPASRGQALAYIDCTSNTVRRPDTAVGIRGKDTEWMMDSRCLDVAARSVVSEMSRIAREVIQASLMH